MRNLGAAEFWTSRRKRWTTGWKESTTKARIVAKRSRWVEFLDGKAIYHLLLCRGPESRPAKAKPRPSCASLPPARHAHPISSAAPGRSKAAVQIPSPRLDSVSRVKEPRLPGPRAQATGHEEKSYVYFPVRVLTAFTSRVYLPLSLPKHTKKTQDGKE